MTNTSNRTDLAGNPLAAPSCLPFGLPDFTAIRFEHLEPALVAGMAEQREQVAQVAAAALPATFENTMEPLERSGQLLHRAAAVMFNALSSDTTPELDALEARIAPQLAAHEDAIYQDQALFARLDALTRADGLTSEQARLVEEYHRRAVRAGAGLGDDARARLRAINEECSSLQTAFGQKLLADTNDSAVLFATREELAGLAEADLAAARQAAADRGLDGYLITLILSTCQPVLASLTNPDSRRRIQEASERRGARGNDNDTRATVLQLARLRAEKAALLGFATFADYEAANGTAGTTGAIDALMAQLTGPAVANARREANKLVAAGAPEPLQAADWSLYSEKVRRSDFGLDDSVLRPYLELDRVLVDGVFYAAGKLYGLSFTERTDLLGYRPDVRVFEVRDDAGPVGLFLADYFTRDSKRGGAWMNSLVDQSTLLGQLPVVVNNCNFTAPAPGQKALLSFDEVTTMFHEFGHALHGLLSRVTYPSLSGTEVARDFVEFPSQVNEMWAWDPQVLAHFARHVETGEPMPQEYLDTLIASRQWGEGFATTEYLGAALLDQAWHRLAVDEIPSDVEAFEAQALARAGVDFAPVPPRYRSAYFNHVFGGDYCAGYYSYIWAEVLDADCGSWFAKNGGLSRSAGDRFRQMVLSVGNSTDPLAAYKQFRGGEPSVEPLLIRRGLAGTADA